MSVHTLPPGPQRPGGIERPGRALRGRARPSLLDVAAEVLVADPSASLAEVAEAAGIGRTTLHKHYATRDDLLRAVAHRVLDLWEAAVAAVSADAPDGGLRDIVGSLVRIGLQMGFLWRTPALDKVPDVEDRWEAVEARGLAVLRRAQERGVLAAGVPDWWLVQTLYSLIYTAAESVHCGRLAPRDAPDLVLDTMLRGIGASRD